MRICSSRIFFCMPVIVRAQRVCMLHVARCVARVGGVGGESAGLCRKCICICESQVAHGLQMFLTLDRRRTDSYKKNEDCEWERRSAAKRTVNCELRTTRWNWNGNWNQNSLQCAAQNRRANKSHCLSSRHVINSSGRGGRRGRS